MAQYGDNIFSTVHKRVVPCPSTVVGEGGGLRNEWDGKDSVLDKLGRQANEELDTLLTFERTRTNQYRSFSGSSRIRGGKSEMSKIMGRGPTGGRSQLYRSAIVDFLQDRNAEAAKQNAARVERDFRKKLDKIRVTIGIKNKRTRLKAMAKRVANTNKAVNIMRSKALLRKKAREAEAGKVAAAPLSRKSPGLVRTGSERQKAKRSGTRKFRPDVVGAGRLNSTSESDSSSDCDEPSSPANAGEGTGGASAGDNGSTGRASSQSPNSQRPRPSRRPLKAPQSVRDYFKDRARSAPYPPPKPQSSNLLYFHNSVGSNVALPSTRVDFQTPSDDMRLRYLGPTQVRSLQESIANSHKTSFDFSDNDLSDRDAVELLESLHDLAMKYTPQYHIAMANNNLRNSAAQGFARLLEFKTLVVLNLNNNRMGDRGSAVVFGAIQDDCAMRRLLMNRNEAGPLAAEALGRMLARNSSLIQLHVSYNFFDPQGADKIFEGLFENNGLLDLDISWNCLGGGQHPLAASVQEGISHKCMSAIARLCSYLKRGAPLPGGGADPSPVCKLRHLDISHNQLPVAACRHVSKACTQYNKNIQCVHMSGNAEGLDGLVYDQSKALDDVFCRMVGLEDIRNQPNFQRCMRCWICERFTPVRITWDPHFFVKQDFLLPDAVEVPKLWESSANATSQANSSVRTLVHVYIPLADGPDVVCEWNSDELHLTQEPIDPSMDCPNGCSAHVLAPVTRASADKFTKFYFTFEKEDPEEARQRRKDEHEQRGLQEKGKSAQAKKRGKVAEAAMVEAELQQSRPDAIMMGNGQLLAYEKKEKPTPLAVIEAAKAHVYESVDGILPSVGEDTQKSAGVNAVSSAFGGGQDVGQVDDGAPAFSSLVMSLLQRTSKSKAKEARRAQTVNKALAKMMSKASSNRRERSRKEQADSRRKRMQRMFDRTPAFDLEYKDGATESAVPRYYIKARELDGKELVKERRHQVRHDPIELLKKKFMAACYSYKGDWLVMFRKMDKDGSGDLDMEEFTNALRFEAKINKDILPDDDIKDVFAVIDEDNGGTIDGEEFVSFLEGSRDVNILPHEEKRLQAKLDLERLGRHWKAEVMPETNKMDPVVHALNFRSDQAQVLQLRAKIINSKALYDEFCKEAENEAAEFADRKYFRTNRVVLARFRKGDAWLQAKITKVHPPKVRHTNMLKLATELSDSDDEDDDESAPVESKAERYISTHNPVWTPATAKDGRSAANVLQNVDLVPGAFVSSHPEAIQDTFSDSNGLGMGSDMNRNFEMIQIARPGSPEALGPGGRVVNKELQHIVTNPVVTGARKVTGSTSPPPLGGSSGAEDKFSSQDEVTVWFQRMFPSEWSAMPTAVERSQRGPLSLFSPPVAQSAEEWLAFARQAVAVDTAQSRIEVALHYAVKSRLRSLLSEIRRASSRASTAQSQRRSTRPQSPARNESSRAMSPLRLDALAQHSMSDALDVSGSESETGDESERLGSAANYDTVVEGGGSETAMARALLEKELVGIQKVLSVYWNTLESIFRYYSARDGDPFSVTWMSFTHMLNQCKIPINPIFKVKDGDTIFIASNSFKNISHHRRNSMPNRPNEGKFGEVERSQTTVYNAETMKNKEKEDKEHRRLDDIRSSNPSNALIRFEFFEALVRVAIKRYMTKPVAKRRRRHDLGELLVPQCVADACIREVVDENAVAQDQRRKLQTEALRELVAEDEFCFAIATQEAVRAKYDSTDHLPDTTLSPTDSPLATARTSSTAQSTERPFSRGVRAPNGGRPKTKKGAKMPRLMKACIAADVQAVYLFAVVDKDPVNVQTSKGFTPLALCVRKCNAVQTDGRKLTKEEIEKAAEAKSSDDGMRPGTLAFDFHNDPHMKCAQLLIHAKCDLNIPDGSKNTPLHHAYRRGLPSMAALLLGMGIVPDTANRMAQTAEQLAPVSDRHFHLKATVTASAAKGLHKKFLKSFFSNRAAKQEFVQTLVSDEKALIAKRRAYADETQFPQAQSVGQALQWLVERHLLNHEGAMISQQTMRNKWLNDWVVYDIIMHKYDALERWFESYCFAQRKYWMWRTFVDALTSKRLIDKHLSDKDAKTAFVMCTKHVTDVMITREHTFLRFRDVLEAVCVCAQFKFQSLHGKWRESVDNGMASADSGEPTFHKTLTDFVARIVRTE